MGEIHIFASSVLACIILNMPHKQDEHSDLMQNRASLTRFAWLSISAAIATITLKGGAYFLTGSVGLLSDALESFVNLAGGVMALVMLTVAARPADESHVYGHSKAEYFASLFEGLLILGAAAGIIITAVQRLLVPRPLEQLGLGLSVSLIASLINLGTARILMKEGDKRKSITLEADAQHLMTDVWTSAGILAGLIIVGITNWTILDPIVGFIVGANIVRTGFQLMLRSTSGLMDAALPASSQQAIQEVISKYSEKGVTFHALRTRQAAARQFVSVHMLVPGNWTVHDAHHIAEDFEADIRAALGGVVTVFTHMEPVEDELSMEDIFLDRKQ
jgi:cation diffusion facilitator family transporter